MIGNRNALLFALGVDNLGAGLFLPLTLVYVTQVVGLSLTTAAVVVTAGTVAGLAVPPVAGRLVDRVGPRAIVITAQVLQAGGSLGYLVAPWFVTGGAAVVAVAALLQAAGQQGFYSALFSLVADVHGDGPQDRPFTLVTMVRSAAFATGTLTTGAVLGLAGPGGFIAVIGADIGCLLLAAVVLTIGVGCGSGPPQPPRPQNTNPAGVLGNRPYLGLIAVTMLLMLSSDVFLVGMPVYVLQFLHGPVWLPGILLTVVTVSTSVAGAAALRLTRRLTRPDAMRLAAGLTVAWCALSAGAVVVPTGAVTAYLVAVAVMVAITGLVLGGRANALAEAAAPRATRGRHLAAFQYAFTVAGVIAPALTALFTVATWLPWLVVASAAALAGLILPSVAARLPAAAVSG